MDNKLDIDEIAKSIPERLKIARLSRDFKNRSTFAKHCGASITTYRAHERGDNELKVTDAIRYSSALNVSLWWLLTGQGTPFTHAEQASPLETAKFNYNIRVEASKASIKADIEKDFGFTLDRPAAETHEED